MNDYAYIYDTARSAFGTLGGSLSSVRPDDLLAYVIRELVGRNDFDLTEYEDVIAGNTNQAGEDSRNVARFAGLLAGLPISTGGITVNRLCGSSMAAALDAARAVRCKEGELFIACGVESMSRAPLVLSKATSAFDRGQQLFDTTMGARFTNPNIADTFGVHTMPQTADNIASDLSITRSQCDIFSARSQTRYQEAKKDGLIAAQIVPIAVSQGRKKTTIIISEDEHPREGSTLEVLAGLRTLANDGVVTAGNASGLNDGAAAMIIGSQAIGEKYGVASKGRILAGAVAGVEPRTMGLGPVPASQKALSRAGLSLDQMDVIEINEAFAVQVLGCLQLLGIDFNDSRVNAYGGAIAVGHPLGASGARIIQNALTQLEANQGRYALVTMCIGIGQGIAVVIERVKSDTVITGH
jgi:acetyl-CoA C-acetyltransferase